MTGTSYQDFFVNAVDAKSRLSIPAAFRDVISARAAVRQVIIGPGHAGRRCLLAYDQTYSAEMKAKFDARHGVSDSPEAKAELAFLFGSTHTLGIDDAGRVVLPASLKRAGNIGSHVLFVGAYEYFELWDPWAFMAHPLTFDAQRYMVEGELEARGLPLERPA